MAKKVSGDPVADIEWREHFSTTKLMNISRENLHFAQARITEALGWRAKQGEYPKIIQQLGEEAPTLTLEERRMVALQRVRTKL